MIAGKYTTKIIAVIVAIAVALCLLAMVFSKELTELSGGVGVSQAYESKLFDKSDIVSIDIRMDADEWQKMLDNAISEEYYQCDAVINGTTFYSVGIRPKGNTSLSSIVSDPDNDRYSFKLEFDKYVEGQTCWGLDKLILNNNYADATNMKEAVIYDMYRYLGADASLYNYAEISVNGAYWGVYLALEAVEDSFLLRNYGVESGELYKPDSMDMGGGQDGNGGKPPEMPTGSHIPPDFGENTMPEGFPMNMPMGGFDKSIASDGKVPVMSDFGSFGGNGGGFGMGGNGGNLNYSDDELDSYSTIWDGSVSKNSDADHRRVVTALKNISEGNDLETYLDVDNVLKYMAVHSFAVNEDSLSGSMAHNYYLYEYDGKLNILPWDYNLSFGGMGGMGNRDGQENGASAVINDPIDTPFSGTNFFDSLLENEEYLTRYHEYYRRLVEEYVLGGGFDETYNRIRSQIDSLAEGDPNAMYSYEEYEVAAKMLYDVVMLRAKSVLGQLDGTIPSTSEGQRTDSGALIDASGIELKARGTFSGGGFGDEDFKNADLSPVESAEAASAGADNGTAANENMTTSGIKPRDGFSGDFSAMEPSSGSAAGTEIRQNIIRYAVCLCILLLALLLVKLCRRKP